MINAMSEFYKKMDCIKHGGRKFDIKMIRDQCMEHIQETKQKEIDSILKAKNIILDDFN